MFNSGPTAEDVKGFVLNFKQDELYNNNYFIGLLHDENPLRGDRIEYTWYPAGAKTKEESRQLQHTKPLENCVFDFSAGSIEKHHPVKLLMPDGLHDLPAAVRRSQAGGGSETISLGAVLKEIMYQHQATVDVLKAVAEEQPDQLEKMKELTTQSDLDEEKRKQFTTLLDDILAAVNRNSSNSSN